MYNIPAAAPWNEIQAIISYNLVVLHQLNNSRFDLAPIPLWTFIVAKQFRLTNKSLQNQPLFGVNH